MASNNSSFYDSGRLSGQDLAFAVINSFNIIVGVPANCIIVTIVRKTPSMHTTTNFLLMNLAVADLTTLLFYPGMYDFALNKVRLHKTLGDFLCKFFVGNALVPITMNVGALTVCTIAVERYLAMVKPFHTGLRLTKGRVPYVVAFLWVSAVLSCIPDFMTNTMSNTACKPLLVMELPNKRLLLLLLRSIKTLFHLTYVPVHGILMNIPITKPSLFILVFVLGLFRARSLSSVILKFFVDCSSQIQFVLHQQMVQAIKP